MTQITVCPRCTLEALIDQEGLASVLDMIYDLVAERLGEDMDWEDDFMINDVEDVDTMFDCLLAASVIAQGKFEEDEN